jgi:hypothetical protein
MRILMYSCQLVPQLEQKTHALIEYTVCPCVVRINDGSGPCLCSPVLQPIDNVNRIRNDTVARRGLTLT